MKRVFWGIEIPVRDYICRHVWELDHQISNAWGRFQDSVHDRFRDVELLTF